jgi:hypothetical protein
MGESHSTDVPAYVAEPLQPTQKRYQMPYGNVVRVGGGCGPLYI